jgi:hypothetical protein
MSIMPFTQEQLDEITAEENIKQEIQEEEAPEDTAEQLEAPDTEEQLEATDTAEQLEGSTKEEVFDLPEPDYDEEPPVKSKKKRKPLSEETKKKLRESLAKARAKSVEKRKAMKINRMKKEAEEKAAKKKHIRERKAKKMNMDAELEIEAEATIMKKEADMWNDDRITNLMNRTLDTYFTKRQEEKKKRETFPAPQGGYYMPAQPPQNQRAIPKPQPVKPKPPTNPYASLWGLTQEDFDKYGN